MLRRPLVHRLDPRHVTDAQPVIPSYASVVSCARTPTITNTIVLDLNAPVIVAGIPTITARSPAGVLITLSSIALSAANTAITLTFTAPVGSQFPIIVRPYDPAIRTRSGGWITPGAYPITGDTIFVLDNFTDPNGTLLTAHTPIIGGPWIQADGTQDIQSNRCVGNTAGTQNIATIDTGQANVDITATYRANTAPGGDTSSNSGIIFRLLSAATQWAVYVDRNVNQINLYQDFTFDRGNFNVSIPADTNRVIRVTAIGPTITIFLDGTQIIQYLAATQGLTRTKHGLNNFRNTGAGMWDNLIIKAP